MCRANSSSGLPHARCVHPSPDGWSNGGRLGGSTATTCVNRAAKRGSSSSAAHVADDPGASRWEEIGGECGGARRGDAVGGRGGAGAGDAVGGGVTAGGRGARHRVAFARGFGGGRAGGGGERVDAGQGKLAG